MNISIKFRCRLHFHYFLWELVVSDRFLPAPRRDAFGIILLSFSYGICRGQYFVCRFPGVSPSTSVALASVLLHRRGAGGVGC